MVSTAQYIVEVISYLTVLIGLIFKWFNLLSSSFKKFKVLHVHLLMTRYRLDEKKGKLCKFTITKAQSINIKSLVPWFNHLFESHQKMCRFINQLSEGSEESTLYIPEILKMK